MIWFGFMAFNHCRLVNTKFSLFIYIKYIWFGLVGFYGISTIVGYSMPNPLYTYILNWVNRVSIPATGRYCLATLMSSDRTKQICLWMTIEIYIKCIWFGWVLWHINHYRLFNTKYTLHIYACGLMVIVLGIGHGDTRSNPGRDWLHFT